MLYKKIIYVLLMLFILSMISNIAAANAIETMEDNLNVSIADVIMITISCGVIVISAADIRIAIMCAFLLYTTVFIVFTLATDEGYANFNPYLSGVAMMVCFVLLCFMLLLTYKRTNTPVSVV